jgi:hypothetical protein
VANSVLIGTSPEETMRKVDNARTGAAEALKTPKGVEAAAICHKAEAGNW